MAQRVLIVPDKFKGTLSAADAAGAIANGWWSVRPHDELECLPMSDGGDGFGAILSGLIGAEERTVDTIDAAGRPRTARWWWHAGSSTALIESAEVVGLALLPPGKFHPFELDTRGLGAVLHAAWNLGAQRMIAGVGGSATNDAGFGMARAVGWSFFDRHGAPIEQWIKLDRLERWLPPSLPPTDITVAVDVQNPLLGLQGCTRVYGPQKGLRAEQAPAAEACLERLAGLTRQEFGDDIAAEPGAGAAGGLGFGFRVFLGARIESGFEIFARQAMLARKIEGADLVITGEGMIDRQTMMGKGTGQVAQMCRDLGKPCIGLAGIVESASYDPHGARLFHSLHGLAPGMTSPAQAKAEPAKWLQLLAAKVAGEFL